jgi:hypothetical protein
LAHGAAPRGESARVYREQARRRGEQIGAAEVVRSGLTTKCKQHPGPRFPTIGPEHSEASDHIPLVVTIDV